MLLEGKNAIITGARRGIGRKTVETFAAEGANVWACAREKNDDFEKDMAEVANRYNVEVWPLYLDVTDEEQIKAALATVKKQKMNVDVLVNNAGITEASSYFTMTEIERMKKVFEVNFWGMTLMCQYVSRMMIRQNGGAIVNVSSVAGIDGSPAQYEYACSKAAVIGAVKHLSRELSQYNIRVNAVAPGVVDTDMGAGLSDELRKDYLSKVIMNRIGNPSEIANVIAFLGSNLSSYITGQVIRVDGGI